MGFMETAGGDPGISFGDLKANPPHSVVVEVTGPYTIQPGTKPNGDPKVNANGVAIMETVIPVKLTWESKPLNGLGARRLFLSGYRAGAVKSAVIKAGASDIEVGSIIKLTWTAEEKAQTPGNNPSRIFEAEYKSPAAAPAGGGFMSDEPPF